MALLLLSQMWLCKSSRHLKVEFVKRRTLRLTVHYEEGSSVDTSAVADEIAILRELLTDKTADRIYGVVETGLCFRLLPRQTNLLKYWDKNAIRGIKDMGTKDQITGYACSNANWWENVAIKIIGKPNNLVVCGQAHVWISGPLVLLKECLVELHHLSKTLHGFFSETCWKNDSKENESFDGKM